MRDLADWEDYICNVKCKGTKHTLDTDNPQTYLEHGTFALSNSIKLIVCGLAGIIHAFLPEIKCLQFYTSSGIIRAYKKLEDSHRHDPEIEKILGRERLSHIEYWRGLS